MSEIHHNHNVVKDGELSITEVMRLSYNFLTSHYGLFLKLSSIPILLWVWIGIISDFLYLEIGFENQIGVLRAFLSAAFALVWYRHFLMGTEYASYKELYKTMRASGFLGMDAFFKACLRFVIITFALIVPALIISIATMIFQASNGVELTDQFVTSIVSNSVFLVFLLLSPVIIRLSFLSAARALGRKTVDFKMIWNKTKGYTWTIWHLIFRAFLPLSIITFLFRNSAENIVRQANVDVYVADILVELPTAFLTFVMLAIVVAANASAFKYLFGAREKKRD
ncbi:hypothetical protein [Pseudemcibacter aquimaris]|uniref:hypothetical protein n=1 Tax=Pseudemcibacter aquimaris TaxID=2857064 RepID=UPI0020116965|nr:hypothetical protein [Pseudemcibacter aquimaris]MCC3861943.1 hypothetical protein [Pseudemcibacter aquimaris]WDU58695.1 hypothetical protein KW060_00215 [Pseudemcibacter aquimaris]